MDDMESTEHVRRKRPVGVWVITIFYGFSFIFTAYAFLACFTGITPLNYSQQEYFDSLSAFEAVYTISLAIVNITSIVLLFTLNRFAFHLYLTAFILGLLHYLYAILFTNWLAAIGGPGFVGSLMGELISVVIILYIRSLIKKKILR